MLAAADGTDKVNAVLRSGKIGECTVRWEYLVVENTLDAGAFKKRGADGWELVAVVSPAHFVLHYFFKREVRA